MNTFKIIILHITLLLCFRINFKCYSQSTIYKTSIKSADKVQIKATKTDIYIDKQYNNYSDTSKGMSDKPELDLLVKSDNGPNPYFFIDSTGTLTMKFIIKAIDKPIAKNLYDFDVIAVKQNGKIVSPWEIHDNDLFTPSDEFYEGKMVQITCFNRDYKYFPNDTFLYYLRISYTDRDGKRPDTLRRIYYYSIANKLLDYGRVNPKHYLEMKKFLIEGGNW